MDLEKVSRHWVKKGPWRVAPAGLRWIKKDSLIQVGTGVRIHYTAKIGDRVCIGDGTFIARDVKIGAGVCLDRGVNVFAGATIMSNVCVGGFTDVRAEAYLGPGCHVGRVSIVGVGTTIHASATVPDHTIIGAGCTVSEQDRFASGVTVGDRASDIFDLGYADRYRKVIAQVDGVAYIGAGCRWFTLDDAIAHWQSAGKSRRDTMALMLAAKEIARLRGWRTGNKKG